MSGSTIGGVVGGAIGFVYGGAEGARWGWMIGSAIGGYVDPTQIQGPRLQDARTQTSRDGVAIPFGWGTFPTAGNIIWQQADITEHESTETQGKGGPEVTNFTYTRSYAIGICEGPITGLLQIKRNGKLVYDARDDDTLEAEYTAFGLAVDNALARILDQRAMNAKFISRCTVYLGDETQLPDPTIESHLGVGNVPAYRGLAYIVVTDDDVTEMQGAIPQYEFVVHGNGGIVTAFPDVPSVYWSTTDRTDGANGETVLSNNYQDATVTGATVLANFFGVRGVRSHSSGRRYIEYSVLSDNPPQAGFVGLGTAAIPLDADFGLSHEKVGVDFLGRWAAGAIDLSGAPLGDVSAGDRIGVLADFDTGAIWLTINGAYFYGYDPGTAANGLNGTAGGGSTISSGPWFPLFMASDGTGSGNDGARMHVVAGDMLNFPTGDWDAFEEWGIESTPIPDIPAGWYVAEDGTLITTVPADAASTAPIALSTIVADLCEREGLTSDEYDVSQLTDLVPGFRVANEGGADSAIAALMPSYFFDCAEWDGKVRFIKRGGASVFAINGDDLVERDGDAFERERVQEAELLRRVTVGYIDPVAAFGPTTQKWERRAGTVQAKGEASMELPLTLAADTAATIAKKRGLTAWGEPEKQKFSLPYRLAALTPSDVGTYTDANGEVYTLRIMQAEDDSGVRYMEASTNSAEAYGATATGVTPKAPTITASSLLGPTRMVVMDLPLWRSTDTDTLGLYVAVRSYFGGWRGAQIDVSTDRGTSYSAAATIMTQAAFGYTTTALTAETSSGESLQSVTVYLPRAPSSVDYETLLRYNNRAAVQLDSGKWEILQYQTVTALGNDLYTLTGLVRGRYNTTPGAAAASAAFVLLDSAVQFVPTDRFMLGSTLTLRPTTLGTSSDAAVPESYAFENGYSQIEWAPFFAAATRDGSDNVTVTWVGRGRLGTEVSPYHSTHFTGYRVTYSDGQTYDVAPSVTTHTRSSAPASQTIYVTAINDITGASLPSESITV
jgi:uncharacterized protein YcfJ